MAPLVVREPLAALCAFLEQRVVTKNLALLRRIAAEFSAGDEQTLEEFVELGVNLVALLPADAPDPGSRVAAAQLLQRQRLRDAPRPPDGDCVFAFLEKRVCTKNMTWLWRIYDEFLEGREDTLRAFVLHGEEAISILPVFLAPASESPSATPYTLPPRYVPPFALFPQQALPLGLVYPPPPVVIQQVRADYDTPPPRRESAAAHSAPTEHATLAGDAKASAGSHGSEDKLHADAELELVRAEFERIEATEPWESVFHSKLALPLEYERLTLALQHFLIVHGRAIWERQFWLPLPSAADKELNLDRVKRQSDAKTIFLRRVITPVYKLVGARFFVDLDGLEELHEGWWYRRPVVNLQTLCQLKGAAFCIEYLRSQSTKRFPDPHVERCQRRSRGYQSASKSMWATDTKLDPILQSIRALKSGACGPNKDGGDDTTSSSIDSRRAAGSGKTGDEAWSGESNAEL